jgi:biopolymer transport protein ExbD
MDRPGPGGQTKADINMTPLIDIVLVLLIVFIVLVPGLTRALPVVVPQVARTGAPPSGRPAPPLMLSLEPQGLRLQGERMELSRLAQALAPAVQRQPAGMRRVSLTVAGDLAWQRVVDVLDQIRSASDRARAETRARPEWAGQDGGDIQVAMSLEPGEAP